MYLRQSVWNEVCLVPLAYEDGPREGCDLLCLKKTSNHRIVTNLTEMATKSLLLNWLKRTGDGAGLPYMLV